ncbi:hypothetical protein HJA83_09825 [Rhizobium bangladeshense]|uniref:helix-turn-helix transcriptional regulator n=1 Tax=Rhizobium bangladeshense TaxID=1138189 RepID=UPI001C840A32|nr:hypothetical protein [Rhizobium bangladeshense]MBX4901632.1 hypothetical protein [Rhizobium bangladeshense]
MAKIRHHEILPPSLPPIGINREQAAEFIGISPSTFDKMVAAGKMPSPRQISDDRLVYDVSEVEAAFRKIPHRGDQLESDAVDATSTSSNPWDDA